MCHHNTMCCKASSWYHAHSAQHILQETVLVMNNISCFLHFLSLYEKIYSKRNERYSYKIQCADNNLRIKLTREKTDIIRDIKSKRNPGKGYKTAIIYGEAELKVMSKRQSLLMK